MQIHLLAQIASSLAGVHELARELEAEANVVGAAAPLPIPNAGHAASLMIGLRWTRLVAVVAGAGLDGALAAGPGYRMGHSRAGDSIDEARLAAACKGVTDREKERGQYEQLFLFL